MSKSKVANIKSSAGEYLTFVASTGEQGIEIRYEDKNIWLTESDFDRVMVEMLREEEK